MGLPGSLDEARRRRSKQFEPAPRQTRLPFSTASGGKSRRTPPAVVIDGGLLAA
jgi:hypothetical protein